MRKLALFLFLFLGYFAADYSRVFDKQVALLLFCVSTLLMIGFFDFIERFVEIGNEQTRKKYTIKREIFTALFCSVSFFCALVISWDNFNILSDNFDPGTLLFMSIVPIIILLNLNIEEIARITTVLLMIIPFLITIKLYYVAEIAAIITYIFFAVCTLQFFIKELWNKKKISI